MERVRWFLNGLADLLRLLVEIVARVIQGIGMAFDRDIPDGDAELVALLVTGLVVFAFLRRVLKWDRKASQPQSITLKTADTPMQVVTKDFNGLLALLVKVGFVVAAIALLISVRS